MSLESLRQIGDIEVMGENIIKGKEEELLERLEKYCQVQYINYM